MATNTDKEDEQWLSALAGQSDPAADPKINQQAESLRRALKNRSDLLNKQVPEADDAQYQQLLFRLRKEGLNSSNRVWHNPMLLGIAATIFLCVGIAFQMGGFNFNGENKDVLMGGGHETVMIVDAPEARLIELLDGLQLAGEMPRVERRSNGEILVTVKATEKVLDYLLTQRIEPNIAEGKLILKLLPEKK